LHHFVYMSVYFIWWFRIFNEFFYKKWSCQLCWPLALCVDPLVRIFMFVGGE